MLIVKLSLLIIIPSGESQKLDSLEVAWRWATLQARLALPLWINFVDSGNL